MLHGGVWEHLGPWDDMLLQCPIVSAHYITVSFGCRFMVVFLCLILSVFATIPIFEELVSKVLYMVVSVVHGGECCTWWRVLYMVVSVVHDNDCCTWSWVLYMVVSVVHDGDCCTWWWVLVMTHTQYIIHLTNGEYLLFVHIYIQSLLVRPRIKRNLFYQVWLILRGDIIENRCIIPITSCAHANIS